MSIASKYQKFRDLLRFDNAAQVIMNRVLFAKTPVTVYRYRGVTAVVDHARGDQDGVKACLVPGLYDAYIDIIAGELDRPVVFADFGANTGGFPLALLAHGIAIEKGAAVELNPYTCTRLGVNLVQNGLWDRVQIVGGAVCGIAGELNVSLGEGGVSDSINSTPTPGGRAVTVRGWTVDEVLNTHFSGDSTIDICKIDVEGAEYGIFDYPFHSSLRRCRWIIIEIHEAAGRKADEVIAVVMGLNFLLVTPIAKTWENNVFLFRRGDA